MKKTFCFAIVLTFIFSNLSCSNNKSSIEAVSVTPNINIDFKAIMNNIKIYNRHLNLRNSATICETNAMLSHMYSDRTLNKGDYELQHYTSYLLKEADNEALIPIFLGAAYPLGLLYRDINENRGKALCTKVEIIQIENDNGVYTGIAIALKKGSYGDTVGSKEG